MSSTQRAVPDTTSADDELLSMQEVADVVRVPVATLALLAPPRHRPAQLPHRPRRPLLAHRGLRLARRPGEERSPERRLTLLSLGRGVCYDVSMRTGEPDRGKRSRIPVVFGGPIGGHYFAPFAAR